MPLYKLKIFKDGIWDGQPDRAIDGLCPQDAAEAFHGKGLRDAGKPGQLLAQVWLPAKPAERFMFYDVD